MLRQAVCIAFFVEGIRVNFAVALVIIVLHGQPLSACMLVATS